MGLDSVELVVRVEEYFEISIPDPEAASITTVQKFVDSVYDKVKLNPSEKCKSQILFYKFREYFTDRNISNRNSIKPDTGIRELISKDLEGTWEDLEKYLGLKLPALSYLDTNPTKEKDLKVLGVKLWTRKDPVTIGTLGDLIQWTLANNFEKVFNPSQLFNKKDIEAIVIGIISDSMGIPVDEIKLEHSLTSDLGID